MMASLTWMGPRAGSKTQELKQSYTMTFTGRESRLIQNLFHLDVAPENSIPICLLVAINTNTPLTIKI